MSLLGKGVLAIWNGIDRDAEDEFLKWHVHEHIPERVALPGFLRGRRYAALDGLPKFFNFYETSSAADLVSPAYRDALNDPSGWTRDVVRFFRDTSRTVCDVAMSKGEGEGAFVETLRLRTRMDAPAFKSRLIETVLDAVSREYGVVGTHLLEGQAGKGTGETAELRLRGRPDETAAWIVLVETVDQGLVETLRKGMLGEASLTAAGADPEIRRGLYALQFSLAASDLAGPAIRRRSPA
jgi:hypothetical protein